MRVESSQIKNQTLPNIEQLISEVKKKASPEEILELGSPNLGTFWIIEFIIITYKVATCAPGEVPSNAIYRVTPVFKALQDNSFILAEIQGQTVTTLRNETTKKFETRRFEPVTGNFQFPQSPLLPGGHSLSIGMNLIPGGTRGTGKLSEGTVSFGYTIVRERK